MKAGDLVQASPWLLYGYGIVINVQNVEYCKGAFVLFEQGIKLVRFENLKAVK